MPLPNDAGVILSFTATPPSGYVRGMLGPLGRVVVAPKRRGRGRTWREARGHS